MSQAIFPTLPGMTWDVKKTPTWSTKVQQSSSGKELRASYYSWPQYRYTLTYDVLRQSNGLQELQTLAGFFSARQGKYDSFLFADPNDNAVTAHGFGVGDGATTAFQLQRSYAGPRQADNVSGTYALTTTPRYNALQQSGNIAASPWTSNSSGASAPTPTANAGVAPDGTFTATKLAFAVAAGGQWSGWSQPVASVLGSGGSVAGQSYTYSVWLRADVATTISIIIEDNPFSTGVGSVVNVGTTWQRFPVQITYPGGSGAGTNVHIRNVGANAARTLFAWGAQLEPGLAPTTPTAYIPTTSAALEQSPAYWPAQGDGFEPISDLNALAQQPQIFVAGVQKTPLTDYAISSSGLVTFTAAPASGAALTWTGSYYWRCRFDLDAAEFNNFLSQLWDLKTLTFVTVK